MEKAAKKKVKVPAFVYETLLWVLVIALSVLIEYSLSVAESSLSGGTPYFAGGALIAFGLTYIQWGVFGRQRRAASITDIASGVANIVLGVVYMFLHDPYHLGVIYMTFLSLLAIRRGLWLVYYHRPRHIVFAAMIFLVLFILMLIVNYTVPSLNYLIFTLVLTLIGVAHILAIAFSRVRFGILWRIMRRTYVAEILFGLVTLIVVFSMLFIVLDDNIKSFADGLWYCFAIITTIGFGDLTVTDPFARILSVILGIYGIIVVAVITSVIVNFYQETSKNIPDAKAFKHLTMGDIMDGKTEQEEPKPEAKESPKPETESKEEPEQK